MNEFIKKLAIKTVKTMAQTAVGVIGSTALITEVNWPVVGSAVVLSGIMCVLMNIAQIEEK